MSTPAAKRRRIDLASSTLSKPFRSPLKIPIKASANLPLEAPPAESKTLIHSASIAQSSTPAISDSISRMPRTSRYLNPATTKKLEADSLVTELTKNQRALERQIREVKELIHTVEQARKIEKDAGDNDIDGELLALTQRWRTASRSAAEEMFGGVKDRVNRMGGPRAWKEMQKQQQEFRANFDAPEPVAEESDNDDDSDENEPDVEKRDLYAEYDVDPETENEKSQRRVKDMDDEPDQEDEFTMSMMLRTLNIDLKAIGYDKEAQRWTD